MNPLMMADWKRVNRLFTRAMWLVAAIVAFAVWIASAPASGQTHHHRSPRAAALTRAPPVR